MILELLNKELKQFSKKQLESTIALLQDGNTIPFIARYRKELTGSLDEVEIKEIFDRYQYLEQLENRKAEIIRLIDEQGKLTDELVVEINKSDKLNQLEDLYRPYRPKRRTKATIAKERGLEPFALRILSFPEDLDLEAEAQRYFNEDLVTFENVMDGVHEILAEIFGDEPQYRKWVRMETFKHGSIQSKLSKSDNDERKVYEMYYDFSEGVSKVANHRVLALNRAEKEDVIKVSIEVDENPIFAYLGKTIIGNRFKFVSSPIIMKAYEDAYKRFIKPSIEREIRNELSEKAEKQAIDVFGDNLRNLLLQAPLKNKVVMGFDPAFRTGCKLGIVDETGKVLHVDVIYPHKPAPKFQQDQALGIFLDLIKQYKVEMVAIGNGTASRESELFVSNALKKLDEKVYYLIVNEAGASVYSASEIARDEFPDLQVEQRSAISIGRRVQDPLAELVKIDPKAVGVGQYQHDVSQKNLEERLSFVVETAVNQVGVNLNTASATLLESVSGLTKTTAKNIVKMREANGIITSRKQLKEVPRLGPKGYEQAIGFIRIPESDNIFDNTPIHPESYPVADKILKALGVNQDALGTDTLKENLENTTLDLEALNIGKETYQDIVEALLKPGRDFRDALSTPILRSDVLEMEDLKSGMELQGTVRNVVDFGAFVDIGVKQDGLVHISKLSQSFVKHPSDVVSVGDIVKVWILDVDLKKQRIQLTMIQE